MFDLFELIFIFNLYLLLQTNHPLMTWNISWSSKFLGNGPLFTMSYHLDLLQKEYHVLHYSSALWGQNFMFAQLRYRLLSLLIHLKWQKSFLVSHLRCYIGSRSLAFYGRSSQIIYCITILWKALVNSITIVPVRENTEHFKNAPGSHTSVCSCELFKWLISIYTGFCW